MKICPRCFEAGMLGGNPGPAPDGPLNGALNDTVDFRSVCPAVVEGQLKPASGWILGRNLEPLRMV